MKKLNTYLRLCTQVYDISKPTAPEDAYHFYRTYAENANGAILEPMCGTGRFLLPLLEEGFNIAGFDASDHMLDTLQAKAEKMHLKPTVWKGFVEELSAKQQYKLIFIPSGSFCLIVDPEAVKQSLKVIYNHLSKDGIFLFEVETQKSIPPLGIWSGSKWKRDDNKIIIASFCTEFNDSICSSIGKYELVDGNHIIHSEIEEYHIKIYEHSELIALLNDVGFTKVRTIKAFDENALPEPHDESIVYECKK